MLAEEVKENYASGYVKIYRSLKKHWLWSDPVKFQWWVDILFEVNHADKKVLIGNKLLVCKRGESIKSLGTWSKEWRTTKTTVRTFFFLLKNDFMITTETVHFSTRLTVCNYDSYQDIANENFTTAARPLYPNKEYKNIKKEKESLNSNGKPINAFVKNAESRDWILSIDITPFSGNDFNKQWIRWLDRLANDSNQYLDERSQEVAFGSLMKCAKTTEEAISVIEQAIPKGFSSFIPVKKVKGINKDKDMPPTFAPPPKHQ